MRVSRHSLTERVCKKTESPSVNGQSPKCGPNRHDHLPGIWRCPSTGNSALHPRELKHACQDSTPSLYSHFHNRSIDDARRAAPSSFLMSTDGLAELKKTRRCPRGREGRRWWLDDLSLPQVSHSRRSPFNPHTRSCLIAMTDDTCEHIRAAYSTSFVQNCCVLATTVLLWLDWMYIFPAEASLIWGRRFTGTTVLYLLNRYTALAERIIFISETFLPTWSEQRCGSLIHADDAILALNYFAFAAFTIIRVYAVWGRDWKPLVVVIPLSMARPILFIIGSIFHVPSQGEPPDTCMRAYTLPDALMTKFETISIAANVASEGIFLMLTWIKTYGIAREYSRLGLCSPLTTLLLRDGTAYFVALFPSKVLSVISDLSRSPTTFLRIWPYIDDAFTTCLLCRFLLDLRGVCFADDLDGDPETTNQFAGVHFSTDITDKLGASLRLSADAFDSQSDFEDGSHRGSTDVQGDPESESVAGKALQCAVDPFKGSSRILEDPRKPKLPPQT